MKELMIGTNSAVEVLEVGGVDEECSSESGPSEGATDALKKVSFSSESGDRARNVDKTRPITRDQCLFRADGSGAYVCDVSLVSGAPCG